MHVNDIRNNQDLLEFLEGGGAPEYLFFWGHRPARKGIADKACFSQWFPSPFESDGIRYPTAEHYMMAEKALLFGDEEIRRMIIAAETPHAAKKLGRKVRDFDSGVWEKNRFDIVVRGNREKFAQNDPLLDYLLETEGRVLVEASPVDSIWGIGLKADDAAKTPPARWKGLNLLGYALMEARARFLT